MLEIMRRNALRLNALVTTAFQEQYNLAASTAEEIKVAHNEVDLWPLVQAMIVSGNVRRTMVRSLVQSTLSTRMPVNAWSRICGAVPLA